MKLANINEKELTQIEKEEEIKVDIEMGEKGAINRDNFENQPQPNLKVSPACN